jgi:hypothetical protein
MCEFLIWFGLVGCALANGFIFDYVSGPEKSAFMVIISCIAAIILGLHRVFTRNWHVPENESDPPHQMVFGISAGVTFFVLVIVLLSVKTGDASWGAVVGVITAFVCFLIAYIKEHKYVEIY